MLLSRSISLIFSDNGLQVFDVEELPTHGGSLRVFAQNCNTGIQSVSNRVIELRKREVESGMNTAEFYKDFQTKADKVKNDLLRFLIKAKQNGKNIASYGAAAKGNTLFNYAGIKSDLIPFVCDIAPSKQGKFLPGSHIPILDPEVILVEKPDFVIISPWNIASEVISQHSYIRDWGGKFVLIIPKIQIIV